MFGVKNMRETGADGRCGLNCRKGNLTNIIRLIDPEASSDLIEGQSLLETSHIRVHMANILGIEKNERFFQIETKCENILDILNAHSGVLSNIFVSSMEILLIVSDLDDQGHVKGFLHVFSENKWDEMTHMHRIANINLNHGRLGIKMRIIFGTCLGLCRYRDKKVFLFHRHLGEDADPDGRKKSHG